MSLVPHGMYCHLITLGLRTTRPKIHIKPYTRTVVKVKRKKQVTAICCLVSGMRKSSAMIIGHYKAMIIGHHKSNRDILYDYFPTGLNYIHMFVLLMYCINGHTV